MEKAVRWPAGIETGKDKDGRENKTVSPNDTNGDRAVYLGVISQMSIPFEEYTKLAFQAFTVCQ